MWVKPGVGELKFLYGIRDTTLNFFLFMMGLFFS